MIIFVVPAYNEERNIARLVETTDSFLKREKIPYRLIVVDDGSSDRTAEIVRQKSSSFPCSLISYRPNRGVDEAFRQGLKQALTTAGEGDFIVTMEADLTGDLGILKGMAAKLAQGFDVVVASYYAEGGGIEGTAWYRKILSRCANLCTRMLFRIQGIHTYSSFYRAYKPQALEAVLKHYGDFYQEKGFACVVELLIRIDRLKFRIGEVPMVLRGSERAGKSKMKIGRTLLGYLRISVRNVFKWV